MPKQRNYYHVDFKAKVALAAITGQHTANEIAANVGVHPHQVVQWKKQALEALPGAFSSRYVREAQGEDAFKAQLYQQIGCCGLIGTDTSKRVIRSAEEVSHDGRETPNLYGRVQA